MTPPALYLQFFIDKNDERFELFQTLQNNYNVKKGIYPGSFVHITPSFIIPEMVYVDSDKRCKKFFNSEGTHDFIEKNKVYSCKSEVRFYGNDYEDEITEKENSFDLLISFYAGFISKHFKKYLKPGGILLVNNSHGDAPLAFLDNDFTLTEVIQRDNSRFTFSTNNLHDYFQPTPGKKLDRQEIERTMRGPGYTKTAYAYIFQKH